jgi:hypothetical protein
VQLLPRQYPLSPAWRWTSFAVWASKVVRGTKRRWSAVFTRRKRSLRTRRLEPETEIDQGNPAYPEPEVAEYPTAARLYIRFLASGTTLSRKRTIVLITASRTWAQSEGGHPSRVMTRSGRLRDCALIGAGAIPRRGHDCQHAIPR